jgi:hypothetical protein
VLNILENTRIAWIPTPLTFIPSARLNAMPLKDALMNGITNQFLIISKQTQTIKEKCSEVGAMFSDCLDKHYVEKEKKCGHLMLELLECINS